MRREFITLIGGVASWPLVARAQNSTKIFRIAVFPDFIPQVAVWFSAEMSSHGWIEGRDLIIEQFGSKLSASSLTKPRHAWWQASQISSLRYRPLMRWRCSVRRGQSRS